MKSQLRGTPRAYISAAREGMRKEGSQRREKSKGHMKMWSGKERSRF